MLVNVGIKTYIDERLEEIKTENVANQQEVMEYLTSIVRGEQTEEVLKGQVMGEQTLSDIEVSAKDRIKAAELIGQRYGMWKDKQEIEHSGAVKIIDNIPFDDDD